MASVLYTLAFLATIIMMTVLVISYKNRISIFYVMLFAAVLISNFGYMQLVSARNLEAAVYANQIIYLGGSFSPFFMLMCVADLCKIRVPSIIQSLLLTCATILFVFVSTIGYLPYYYKTVSFTTVHGMGTLVKEYGPLHILYPIYVILIGIIGIGIIIVSFRRKKDVSHVTCLLLMICMLVIDILYVVEKLADIEIELVPFAYVISLAGCLFLLRRISMYEVTVISTNSMVESLAYGFVICDSNGRYLGSDEAAKLWFPELRDIHIDTIIENEDTVFLKQVGKWLRDEDIRDKVFIEQDNQIFEAQHSIIKECKHHNVHCIYLRDETKQQQYTKLVQQYNENLERDVEAKTENMRKVQKDILLSMASIVENRDSNTGGHIARTSDIVTIFVDYLQSYRDFKELTPHMAKSIIKAAPLHDFGKIAIPDVILNKPGKFTDDEYEIMKQHSAKGSVIVERILHHSDDARFRTIAVNVAHFHHEKWDGKGYPQGLKGEEIPFEARVMALADVFDALVSKRVYKESFGYDRAFTIIEESVGSHFDPELGQAFLECRPLLEALYDSYED